jgi:hypothetical protein
MSDIKPKMVDGEAVCVGQSCPACNNDCMLHNNTGGYCAPYYRARVAELEDEVERLREDTEFRATREERNTATARVAELEVALAEEKRHHEYDVKGLAQSAEKRLAAECERDELQDEVKQLRRRRNRDLDDYIDSYMRLESERDELRKRLQFDPGGSDKIDELEMALQFSRHNVTVEKARADAAQVVIKKVREWAKIYAPIQGQPPFTADRNRELHALLAEK